MKFLLQTGQVCGRSVTWDDLCRSRCSLRFSAAPQSWQMKGRSLRWMARCASMASRFWNTVWHCGQPYSVEPSSAADSTGCRLVLRRRGVGTPGNGSRLFFFFFDFFGACSTRKT